MCLGFQHTFLRLTSAAKHTESHCLCTTGTALYSLESFQ